MQSRFLPKIFIILFISIVSTSVSTQDIVHAGTFGSTQLQSPRGIKVFDNVIYIVDSIAGDVKMYNLQSKTYLGAFGSQNLVTPIDIAFANDTIYVTDNRNLNPDAHVEKFDLVTKNHLGFFTNPSDFEDPQGIAIEGGEIFVVENLFGSKVQRFDLSDNSPQGDFGSVVLSGAFYIAIYNDTAYVTEGDNVELFDITNGSNVGCFVTNSVNRGIAVNEDYIFIALLSGGFQVFDRTSFANLGTFGESELSSSQGITVNGNMIFVSEEVGGEAEMFMIRIQAIPTLSQWGMIILFLLLSIIGILQYQQYTLTKSNQIN